MKLLVIGASGFVGSKFCELVRKNKPTWQVMPLDKNINSDNMYKFDICNKSDIDMLACSINETEVDSDPIVVNFASESIATTEASAFVDTNFKGVSNLLEICNSYNLRFIQISTNKVLGGIPINSKKKLNNNSPMNTNTINAATKASAEILVRSYIKAHGLHANIIRSTSNYGIIMHIIDMIPKAIINLLNDKPISEYETANTIHNWVHVEDHCLGIIKVIENGIDGETYMFAGNTELSNIDLMKMICDELSKDYSYIKNITDCKEDGLSYVIKKHTPGISWTPKKNLKDEIGNICNWYKENINVK